MAHFAEPFRCERSRPQTPEEFQTWNHVRRVSGLEPASIRVLANGVDRAGVCIVKVRGGRHDDFEFICADGLLVGIPPKGRGLR